MTDIRIENLSVSIGGKPVLADVSFSASSREIIGLIGPNGAGKSTLLKAIIGLVPSSGKVTLFEREKLTPRERAHRACYVPQDREVAWPLSVRQVVALGRTPFLARAQRLSADDEDLIREAMRQVDIAHLADRNVLELSGGERARVLIARALAQNAPLLIADEPAAGLDPAHQIALMEIIAARARCQGLAIVTIHDMGLAARWFTRLLVLHNGRLVADGSPEQVLRPDLFARVYGIDVSISNGGSGPIVHTLGLSP